MIITASVMGHKACHTHHAVSLSVVLAVARLYKDDTTNNMIVLKKNPTEGEQLIMIYEEEPH